MKIKHQQEKLLFQIERIAFFSDALIAIAVTLLVIEIKAPHIIEGSSLQEQIHQLSELLPEFIAFSISFAMIMMQWRKHHEMFGRIVNYDSKLISLNTIFLFTIAIIPFSTSYFAHNNIKEFYLPYLIYGSSLILLTLFNYLLFRHSIVSEQKLTDGSYSKIQLKWLTADYLLFPISIFFGLLFGFINLKLGLAVYLLFMLSGFYISKQKNKYNLN